MNLDPQTATDAEVNEWLAEHCMKWTRGKMDGEPAYFDANGDFQREVFYWNPTETYDDLRLCEARIEDRRTLVFSHYVGEDWKAEGYRGFDGPPAMVFHPEEISARARLVMAVLQQEEANG